MQFINLRCVLEGTSLFEWTMQCIKRFYAPKKTMVQLTTGCCCFLWHVILGLAKFLYFEFQLLNSFSQGLYISFALSSLLRKSFFLQIIYRRVFSQWNACSGDTRDSEIKPCVFCDSGMSLFSMLLFDRFQVLKLTSCCFSFLSSWKPWA